MSILFQKLFSQYMRPAGEEDGGGSGGTVDRGDDVDLDDPVGDDDGADAGDESSSSGERDEKGRFKAKNTDDESGDEDDGDESDKSDEGKNGKKKPIMIPKARFDELNRSARETNAQLQARIDQLEKQSQREAQTDDVKKLNDEVETLEADYSKALADGNTAKAQELMRSIRLKERRIVEIETEYKSARARDQALEQFKLDSLIDKLESDFPVLNPDTDEYDQEKVDEIGLLRTGFERGGLSSSAALAKAVKYVLGEAQTKEAEKSSQKRGLGGGDKGGERRQKQLEKNIDASKRQPPRLDDSGVDSSKKGGGIDAKSVARMTEEEFKALPESTKARLRGDIIDENASA